jgi:hypothetical protein
MKRRKPSKERRAFERETLKKLSSAGATLRELAKCRSLLVRGRGRETGDYCELLNRRSQERACIELVLRALRGELPDTIIWRLKPCPEASIHG